MDWRKGARFGCRRILAFGPVFLTVVFNVAVGELPPIGGQVGWFSPDSIPLPDVGFPGSTASLSDEAWPGGRQPPRLRYWPQISYGLANRTLLGCWQTTVLHTTADGWPGLCVNLIRNTDINAADACKQYCTLEPRCSTWQFVNQVAPGQCWVGYGTQCGTRGGDQKAISVDAAERLMHGEVKVLKRLNGWKINNLYKLGFFAAGDDNLSIERCKAWCYSNIACEYWQFNTAAGGCFVDSPMFSTSRNQNPQNVVQFPLTSNGGATQDANYQVGEYITHYCPVAPASTTTPEPILVVPGTQQKVSHSGASGTQWIVFFGVAALIVLAAAGFIIQQQQQKKNGKVKRLSTSKSQKDYDLGYDNNGDYEEKKLLMLDNTSAGPDSGRSDMGSRQPSSAAPPSNYSTNQNPSYGGPQQPYGGQRASVGYGQQPYNRAPAYGGQGASFGRQNPGGQTPNYGQASGYGQPSSYGPSAASQPGGSYGQSRGGAMPPPTQLVDFGQAGSLQQPGAGSMAPTQLMQPQAGLPFPGQRRSGNM